MYCADFYFNSTIVRLKLIYKGFYINSLVHFNSTIVRLKQKTINDLNKVESYFNSTIVRLKLPLLVPLAADS